MPDYLNPTLIEKKRLEVVIQARNVASAVKSKVTNLSLKIKHKVSNSDMSASDKKTRKEMGSFVQKPKKPTATAGNLFGKLDMKSKTCFNIHMVGLECDLGADCKDNYNSITKMNATEHEAICKRQLTDKTIFLNLGLKGNATLMSQLGE